MAVRQINLNDEELFNRLFEKMNRDQFAAPLIKSHIRGHREDNEESTTWIRRKLGWEE